MLKLILISLLLLPSCTSQYKNNNAKAKQQSMTTTTRKQTKIDFSKALAYNTTWDKKTNILKFDINIANGFHAYAPGEKIGQPIRFDISKDNGWSLKEAIKMPKGKRKDLKTLGTSYVYTGNIFFQAKLKKGKGPLQGILHTQACTNNACDRPRQHDIVINTGNDGE